MKNSVSVVNSGSPRNCALENVQYWEDVTHIYNIDDDGEPNYETEHTDGDFRCYWCECGEEFQSFAEVKEHLNG